MNNLAALILFSFLTFGHVYCHGDDAHKEWLKETLDLFQKRFPFSTKYVKEVEGNKILFSEVDSIVDHVLEQYPADHELIIPCIHLLYVQGNHHLYGDRSVMAQKKLLLARKLCEQIAGLPNKNLAQDICQYLSAVDKRLPSMYAIVLYLLGKSYIYPWDQQNRLQWEEGKSLIEQAIQLREYIDAHPGDFKDDIDNPSTIGNTRIFQRMLGFVYLEEGQLQQAENIFTEIMKVNDEYNYLLCLKHLIHIYQKQGQQAKIEPERRRLYLKAIDCTQQVLKLIHSKDFEDLNRVSIYYSIVGDLYIDPENPFKNAELAHRFFETGKNVNTTDLKSLSQLVHRGLSKTYYELSTLENRKAKSEEWEYSQSASTDFLREINDRLERSALAYEELGDIYLEKQDYITAATLYSNGMSLLHAKFPDLQKRLFRKLELVEKDFYPALGIAEAGHAHLIAGYKKRLENLRNDVECKVNAMSVEHLYELISEEYKGLLRTILSDLMGQMPLPPCAFALICGGSTSFNIATPYSDFELAFIISSNKDEDKRCFQTLSYLLALRLIALGETPIAYLQPSIMPWLTVETSPSPNGLMLDPPQLSPFKFLIGTPKEIASQLCRGEAHSKSCIKLSFLKYGLVAGSYDLAEEYEEELIHNLTAGERSTISRELLMRDLTRWDVKGHFDKNGQRYSAKHDLYRSFDIILYDIAVKYWMRGAKSPWDLIRRLQIAHVLDHEMAKMALDMFDEIGRLRLESYLNSKQRGWLRTSQNKALSGDDYAIDESVLLGVFHFLAAFQEYAKSLEPICHLLEKGITNIGIINLAFLQFDKAEEQFRVALLKDPGNCKAWKNLGILLLAQQKNQEAKSVFEALLKHANSILEFADALHYLGVAELHLKHSVKALFHLKQALDLYEAIFDVNDPFLSDTYIDLGLALVALERRQEGIDCILRRVEIDSRFYGNIHPIVAMNYYRLGCALLHSGNYHEAKLYLEKAIQIDAIMYGTHHVRAANYHRKLGLALNHLSDPVNAAKHFKMALEIDSRFFGEAHPIIRHDNTLVMHANTLPLVFQDISKSTPHIKNKERELAESYKQTHPVCKAQKLHALGLAALLQGHREQAMLYFDLSQLASASYFKQPLKPVVANWTKIIQKTCSILSNTESPVLD